MDEGKGLHQVDTLAVARGRPAAGHGDQLVNPPVDRASTILYPTVSAYISRYERFYDGVMYGLHGTSTRFALADAVASLEHANRTVIVSSGSAAVALSLAAFLGHGDHFLIADTVYGPTRRFAESLLPFSGIEATFFDPLIGGDIASLARPKTKVIFLESPGSMTFEILDIPAIAEVAASIGAVTIMDNSWATPCYFRPLDKGVDVSLQSGSKYLSGHSDVIIGTISINRQDYFERIKQTAGRWGSHVSPDDSYLALRGMRTLPVRLSRHSDNATALIDWLRKQPEVKQILYPGLPSDPGFALWQRDFSGASGLFGAVMAPMNTAQRDSFFNGCRLFKLGSSWGGFESLMVPAAPAPVRFCRQPPADGDLIRIHAGLEDIGDLIADLESAFCRLRAAAE